MTLYNGAILKLCKPDGTPLTDQDGFGREFKVEAMGSLWDGTKHAQIVQLKEII